MRELRARVQAIESTQDKIEDARIRIDALSVKPATPKRELKIRRLHRSLDRLQASFIDREREARRFFQQAVACRALLGYELDQQIPEYVRDRLDRDYWRHRLQCQIAIDMMRGHSPGATIAELIPALPMDIRSAVMDSITNSQATLAWYQNLEHRVPTAELAESINITDSTLRMLEDGARCPQIS